MADDMARRSDRALVAPLPEPVPVSAHPGDGPSRCAYCDRRFTSFDDGPESRKTRDHIIPKLLGFAGPNNLADACAACNRAKGSMTPDAMRSMAGTLHAAAERYERMAYRVEALIKARGLLLPGASQ